MVFKMSRSKSCALPGIDEEKPVHRKPHFSSTALSGIILSWSSVMRGTLLSAGRSSASSSSTNSWTSVETSIPRSVFSSSSSRVPSDVSTLSSPSSSPSPAWRSLWYFGWRKQSKREKSSEHQDGYSAMMLDKLPFTGSGKYLTVYVGVRNDQTVKYVVSRSLVTHPLFQVMLKVSEDEFAKENAANHGVSIVCDPELFLEVVRAVDGNLDSIRKEESEEDILVRTDDESETTMQMQ